MWDHRCLGGEAATTASGGTLSLARTPASSRCSNSLTPGRPRTWSRRPGGYQGPRRSTLYCLLVDVGGYGGPGIRLDASHPGLQGGAAAYGFWASTARPSSGWRVRAASGRRCPDPSTRHPGLIEDFEGYDLILLANLTDVSSMRPSCWSARLARGGPEAGWFAVDPISAATGPDDILQFGPHQCMCCSCGVADTFSSA